MFKNNNNNNNMSFKIPLALMAGLICVNSFASYTVIYPVDYIKFVNNVKWESTDPIYSSWTNTGSPSDCKNEAPLENTIPVGNHYTKTISQCNMTQERTVTEQLIRHDTGEIKANGSYKENRTINDYSYEVDSIGTLVAEECQYSMNGQKYYWYDIARDIGATDGPTTTLMWDNVQVYTRTTGVGGTQLTVGNYKYTRSTFKERSKRNETSWHIFYQICRKPI